MQSPNIAKAKSIEDYKIIITFENGEERIFDVVPYLEFPVFRPLKDLGEFHKFSIIDGTIEWACGADLSTDTFYLGSILINEKAAL